MTIPQRPTATAEMILAAAVQISEKQGWEPHVAESIARNYCHPMDGFSLLKDLMKWESWEGEREDIDALDEMETIVDRAVMEAQRAWVDENSVELNLLIGTEVKRKDFEGTGHITGIYDRSPGCYLVKPAGQDDSTSGNCRWVVKFEDIEVVGE